MSEGLEAYREVYRRDKIEPRYAGWRHFALTTATSLAVIAAALLCVRAPSAGELLVAPLGFLFANAGEYFGHRGPMHHRRRGLGLLFTRHTLHHHRFFTHEAMECASPRDFKLVLFPPVMLIFFFGALATPIGLLLFLLLSWNAGCIFVAMATGYFLSYEWLHLAYHMPKDSWAARLPVLAALRRHHTRHHDPALMARYNFNITFPICDWVMGTRLRPEDERHERPAPVLRGGRSTSATGLQASRERARAPRPADAPPGGPESA